MALECTQVIFFCIKWKRDHLKLIRRWLFVLDQILMFLTIFSQLKFAFGETFTGSSFSACFKVFSNIIWHFNRLRNSFLIPMVFQLLIKSLLIGHFFLEDTHLNIFIKYFYIPHQVYSVKQDNNTFQGKEEIGAKHLRKLSFAF